jgi:hypothetical protein
MGAKGWQEKFIADFAGIRASLRNRPPGQGSGNCRVLHTLTSKLHILRENRSEQIENNDDQNVGWGRGRTCLKDAENMTGNLLSSR